MRKLKVRWVITNSLPAAFFLLLAFSRFQHFWQAHHVFRITHLLLGLQLVTVSFFFVIRREAQNVSWRPLDVLFALLGTFAPSLFALEVRGSLWWGGVLCQAIGVGLVIWGVFSLRRSLGILPANRGIQTRGLYRFIRHPMYTAYQIANVGYLINCPEFYNILVLFVCFLSQVMRIFAEERVLSRDPGYAEYQQRVRWKMIPFIF
ncbi:MAG: isoprenylcysteine carboxyl methyltransferase [Candidatus Omnitrophica bacterium]|nr:isoprenylcysteine carboxyl methyltransferase [Candidatus Omnitrophota bacterium]